MGVTGCPTCGAPRTTRYTLGSLMIDAETMFVYHDMRPLKLSPMETRALLMLVRFGQVGLGALEMVSEGTTRGNVSVLIHQLRRKLPNDIEIVNQRGQGYGIRALTPTEAQARPRTNLPQWKGQPRASQALARSAETSAAPPCSSG